MEGFSKIAYKGKEIYYCDYSIYGSNKEGFIKFLEYASGEYSRLQLPLNSVLALINITDVHFDSDIIEALSKAKQRSAPYEKKIAIYGMRGLQKVVYNFLVNITQRDKIKVFDSLQEAKDWLVE